MGDASSWLGLIGTMHYCLRGSNSNQTGAMKSRNRRGIQEALSSGKPDAASIMRGAGNTPPMQWQRRMVFRAGAQVHGRPVDSCAGVGIAIVTADGRLPACTSGLSSAVLMTFRNLLHRRYSRQVDVGVY